LLTKPQAANPESEAAATLSASPVLNDLGIEPEEAGLKRIPNDTKKVDLDSAKKVLRLIDALEDDDDIQYVYHNLEMTDELAAELG